MKVLHISAGGRGERIANYIASISPLLPKHLLPIPAPGGTILGNIVLRGHRYFNQVLVWSNKETYPRIALDLKHLSTTKVVVDNEMTGPLGPSLRNLLSTQTRTYGCAGDFYCDFAWEDFEKFHESHDKPVSVLVAQSIPVPQGARFILQARFISSF